MKAKILLVAILVAGAAFFCFAITALSGGSNSDSSSSYELALTSEAWRVPSGFRKYSPTIAYRWLSEGFGCEGADHCTAAEIVTRYDCSSVYGEVTILHDGTNVDWTNDRASGVRAGEKTRLLFRWYGRGDQTRLSELVCHQ